MKSKWDKCEYHVVSILKQGIHRNVAKWQQTATEMLQNGNKQRVTRVNWVIPEKIYTSPMEEIPATQGGGRRNVLSCPKWKVTLC